MGLFESWWGEHFPYTNFQELNLNWVIKTVKHCLDKVKELYDKVTELETNIENNLEQCMETWLASKGTSYVEMEVNNYVALGVQFGLTDDGYFVAYYPKEWSQFGFGTTEYDIDVPCQQEYGHLVINYGGAFK